MPKGNPKVTDKSLLRRLSQYNRPISFQELASTLLWNPGKVDGSIRRLQTSMKIATVKIAPPQGHVIRFAGFPNANYWIQFFNDKIITQKYILIDDPLNIAPKYFRSSDNNSKRLLEYKNEIERLKRRIDEQNEIIEKLKSFDTQILTVLQEFQPKLEEYTIKLGFQSSSELLRTILTDELNENIPFFKELIKVFISVYRETESPILRDVIVKAQDAVQRG